MIASENHAVPQTYQDVADRTRERPNRALYYLISAALLFTLWQISVMLTSESARRFLIPTPAAVAARFVDLIRNGTLAHHTGVTLLEMGLGLAAGTSVALFLGYTVAHSHLIAALIEPVIAFSQAIPIVALAPLLTVWFGSGTTSKVVVCALIVSFPILVNVTTGLKNIDPRLRDLFRLLDANRAQTLLQLEIPAALPAILAGLKVGGTMAGMGAVVGEFVASTEGLGYLVKQGQNLYDLPMMFVAILCLMLIASAVYALFTLLEHTLLRWQSH